MLNWCNLRGFGSRSHHMLEAIALGVAQSLSLLMKSSMNMVLMLKKLLLPIKELLSTIKVRALMTEDGLLEFLPSSWERIRHSAMHLYVATAICIMDWPGKRIFHT